MPQAPPEPGRAYWDRNARLYDPSMRLLGRPLPRTLALVAEEVRGLGRVLEVAAGTGLVTVAIARAAREVVATDYSASMVRELERRVAREGLRNVACAERDLRALGYARASFDAVVAANVLHLVPDLAEALAALRAVLREGGRIVVPTFVHAETMLSRAASRVGQAIGFPGRRRLTTATLREAVERAGFRVHRVETVPGIIPIGFVAGTLAPAGEAPGDASRS